MAEDVQWRKTHCGRMDHGGCGLLVGVREGKIVQVKGDPEAYFSRGYVCAKGLASPDRLTHPDRLTQPLRRCGPRGAGQWEQISWDEALGCVAENLDRIRRSHGARAVAFGVGMPKGLEHFVLIRLANLFGSPNVVASQDVCHAPREIAGVHTCGFYPVADFHHPSQLVLLWGSNITATNEEGEICRLLLDQLDAGARLVVIDPRKTNLAGRAAQWVQLRPGTDLALALALLHVVIEERLYDAPFVARWAHGFDELAAHVRGFTPERMAEVTWVPAPVIRHTARLYAAARPAAIQWGNALEHTVHAFDAVRALLCLMAITGNLDVPGGNVDARDPGILGLGEFVRADLLPDKRKEMVSARHGVIPRFMTVPPAYFRRAVLEETPYPIKGFYALGSNALLSYADSRQTHRALEKLDFLAVADLVMTPTAAMADVVLPVASQFEIDDIGHYGLGHGFIVARPKLVEPPAGCRSDLEILNDLGRRLSPPELWHEDAEAFLEDVLAPSGLTYAQFAEKGYLKGPERFRGYEEKGFRTPTGKVELRLSTAEKLALSPLPTWRGLPEEEDPDYPLLLTSAKSRSYLHSSYRWVEKLRRQRPEPRVELHPETAAAHGVGEGDPVVIETRHGSIVQKARLVGDLHPRVLCADHGWWFPEGDPARQYDWDRSNLNMLTSTEALGKEFGTPNLRGLGCRIRRG